MVEGDGGLPFQSAVEAFWAGRKSQADKQFLTGKQDAGSRGAVTGGAHLDAIRETIAEIFIQEGIDPNNIRRTSGVVLPGFYRPAKKWDLLVVDGDKLVAAIELKSQVGPSFGNNFNNRTEEAMGNAVDAWRAYEEGTFGDTRPWLGYVFILEDAPESTKPVSVPGGFYPVEEIFHGTSYKDRYGIFCDRLIKERLYDAAWFLTASESGEVDEPLAGANFNNFAASIQGRCAYIRNLNKNQ
jgi:Restriction endonuclease XhoI